MLGFDRLYRVDHVTLGYGLVALALAGLDVKVLCNGLKLGGDRRHALIDV